MRYARNSFDVCHVHSGDKRQAKYALILHNHRQILCRSLQVTCTYRIHIWMFEEVVLLIEGIQDISLTFLK
jgi:hypothetical protein